MKNIIKAFLKILVFLLISKISRISLIPKPLFFFSEILSEAGIERKLMRIQKISALE